ncbi:MAG: TetR/AcrR family transcriptional regulator [Rhodobacteraceae bacterium]|nr:TetR/AcrR family transcriptional regulator [Paracoccaceae bacterium]
MSEKAELGKQKAKSLRARTAICKATISCLISYGYGETSLQRVAQKAEFSKGALQHHFPSKEDLMVATADTLLARPLAKPDDDEDQPNTVEEMLLLTWVKFTNTGAYRALLEILCATRTDLKLRDRVSEKLKAWNAALDQQAMEVYRAKSGDDADTVAILTMSRAMMRGLVIQHSYSTDPEETLQLVQRWIALIAPMLELRKAP